MFDPIYRITNQLLSNIKQITTIITELNRKNLPKNIIIEMERYAREVSSYSSTSIEGNPLPLTDVKRILKVRPTEIHDSEREVLNYNEILLVLNEEIRNKKVKFDLDLILKIQKKVTEKLLPKFHSGFLRKEPVFVNDPKLHKTVYLAPDHKDIETLLKDLINFINKNENIIDPLILAGIFHKQFVIIHPFIDGNGRTARLATKVLLSKMGINTFNLFSFENYYNKNVSKYFENVGTKGDFYDLKDKVNFTSWLEYFTEGIIDELNRVKKELERQEISPDTDLKEYHKKILDFIKEHGYITDADYVKLTPRAKATRSLDFNKLIQLGFIKRHGKGRLTHYKFLDFAFL